MNENDANLLKYYIKNTKPNKILKGGDPLQDEKMVSRCKNIKILHGVQNRSGVISFDTSTILNVKFSNIYLYKLTPNVEPAAPQTQNHISNKIYEISNKTPTTQRGQNHHNAIVSSSLTPIIVTSSNQSQVGGKLNDEILYVGTIIINDRFEFRAVEIIGQGGFGLVILYIHIDRQNRRHGFVVKYGDIKSEIEILKFMKERSICGTSYIYSKHEVYINNQNIDFIIMNYMEGNLKDYIYSLKLNNIDKNSPIGMAILQQHYKTLLQIFSKVISQIYCLYTHDLYFTDIKLENILYKFVTIDNHDTIEILLGDTGSICNASVDKNAYYTTTYPAPLKIGSYRGPTDKDLSWSCGILFLSFFGDVSQFSYKTINSNKNLSLSITVEINKIKNLLNIQHNNSIIDTVIKKMLNISPNLRLSLKDVFEETQILCT